MSHLKQSGKSPLSKTPNSNSHLYNLILNHFDSIGAQSSAMIEKT